MISLLSDLVIDKNSGELYGRLINQLIQVNTSCLLNVEKSIVIDTRSFIKYQQERLLQNDIIDACMKLIPKLYSEKICVSISVVASCLMNDSEIVIRSSDANLKNVITMLYESWFSAKCASYRLVHHLSQESTFPAILIQPYCELQRSTITRHPVTGNIIRSGDGANMVHCTSPCLEKNELNMIEVIDRVIDMPCKIHYTIDFEGISIRRLDEYSMTKEAKIRVLLDRMKDKRITIEEFVSRIMPDDIATLFDKQYQLSSANRYYGLQATPYPIVEGFAVFPWTNIHRITNQSIMIAMEATPEDIEKLRRCCGAIFVRGGITSHGATICRGFKISCIVGSSYVHLNESEDCVLTTEGERIIEGDRICICFDHWCKDGEFMVKNTYRSACSDDLLDQLQEMILRFSDSSVLKYYPLEFQLHIARLIRSLRIIGRYK